MIEKKAIQEIRDEILVNKEFFLLSFMNDIPCEFPKLDQNFSLCELEHKE